YDARLAMTMPRSRDDRIVILDIDEKSLGEIGRWPWSRNVLAELVDKLFERHGVALAAFDVVLAERDPSSGIDVLDRLAQGEWKGYTGNLPPYVQNAAAAGHINPFLDGDGVLRRVPLILEYQGEYYEALSLAVFRTLLTRSLGAMPAVQPGFKGRQLESLKVG